MSVLAFTLLTGLLFPALITVISKVVMPAQAGGSLITQNGKVIGSTLIAQPFAKPIYFHPRPSAAGNGYDGSSSGGTNLGPTSDKLINGVKSDPKATPDPAFAGIKQLVDTYRTENALPANADVPPDAVTRSASGLDPEISPENAALQAPRVAKARNLSVDTVQGLVAQHTQGRTFGVLGEPRVNVLQLNLALDAAK